MYLVSFVVVLWVILKNLFLLWVFEVADQVVEVELFSPFLALDEPMGYISLWSTKSSVMPYISCASFTSNFRARRNRSYFIVSTPEDIYW